MIVIIVFVIVICNMTLVIVNQELSIPLNVSDGSVVTWSKDGQVISADNFKVIF